MKQRRMESKDDMAKRRWMYLRQKAGGTAFSVALSIASLAFVAIALCFLRSACNCITADPSHRDFVSAGFIATFGTIVLVFGLYIGRLCVYSFWETSSLPSVPPVAEQIASLRANAVLLRGSEQPIASPGEMLRAVSEKRETDETELVRGTNAPERLL